MTIQKPDQAMRVRFAPSPTGYLHIGGARTALFNFLLARRHGGTFVLRVEDTDQARNSEESRQAILNGLKWLNINWDEGPFYQSERTALYLTAAEQLIKAGKAYRCDCTVEVLDAKRKQAMAEGRKAMYDGTCRDRKLSGTNTVVRFRGPTSGTTTVHDLIKGDVVFDHQELDDMVLVRTDGMPTYNFVVVVDDADMRITHVIRGDDHLNNTPKQILLYQAMEKPIPQFAHVPLILGTDKTRLSKRHGATSVEWYGQHGFLPEAMLNFLVRLGWSHGDQEIFSIDEMIQTFDLEHVGKSAGIFNEEKLLWLNHHYIKNLPLPKLTEMLTPHIKEGVDKLASPSWPLVAQELMERSKTLPQFFENGHFFFCDQVAYAEAAKPHLNRDVEKPLESLTSELANLKTFDEASIEQGFAKVLEALQVKLKVLAQPVRVALTGTTTSPGIYRLVAILGQAQTLKRLRAALEFIKRG